MFIGTQNPFPITFCSDLVCNKTLKVRNATPTRHTHEFLTSVSLLHIKSHSLLSQIPLNNTTN